MLVNTDKKYITIYKTTIIAMFHLFKLCMRVQFRECQDVAKNDNNTIDHKKAKNDFGYF